MVRPVYLGLIIGTIFLVGCAAPAPIATPTIAVVAVPTKVAATPTKAPTSTPTKRPLVKMVAAVSSFDSMSQAGWAVAKAKNYFVEEGLDIEWVVTGSGAKALAAAVGQSAHLTTAATPEVLSAIAQGQPVQTAGIVTVGESTGIVMRKEVAEKKGIGPQTSLADRVNALKGLKISASSPGSGTDNALRYVLTKFNVDPDRDVEVTYMGLPASLQALEAGAVEAMVNSEVRFSQAVVAGFGIDLLILGRDLPETRQNAYGTITFPKNVLASQPEIAEAFIRATWRGMRFLKENRLDAEEAFRKDSFPDLDPVVFKATFDASYWRFPDSPAVTREQFQAALEYRNRTSKEEPLRVTYEEYYNPKIIEAAKKQLGF